MFGIATMEHPRCHYPVLDAQAEVKAKAELAFYQNFFCYRLTWPLVNHAKQLKLETRSIAFITISLTHQNDSVFSKC